MDGNLTGPDIRQHTILHHIPWLHTTSLEVCQIYFLFTLSTTETTVLEELLLDSQTLILSAEIGIKTWTFWVLAMVLVIYGYVLIKGRGDHGNFGL